MRHVAWLVVLMIGCDRAPPKTSGPPPGVAPTPTFAIDAGSAGSGNVVATGTGSGSAAIPPSDVIVEQVVADTIDYAQKMLPLILAFDGDCDAHADRLLKLEPLVASIRSRTDYLSRRDPVAMASVKALIATRKDAVLAQLNEQMKNLHTSKEEVDRKDDDIKVKCANSARVNDAMNRVGLFKKKSQNPNP